MNELVIKDYGKYDMIELSHASENFNKDHDEIWLSEPSVDVYHNGIEGSDLFYNHANVEVYSFKRGGHISYFGPGQLCIWTNINLRNRPYNIKGVIDRIQNILVDMLLEFGIKSRTVEGRPGVYIGNKKVASIGFGLENGQLSYGMSINVNTDLHAFNKIIVCGYSEISAGNLVDYKADITLEYISNYIKNRIGEYLEYESVLYM